METNTLETSDRQQLLEISTRIASTLDAGQVAKLLVDGLSSIFEYDAMAFYTANHARQEFTPIITKDSERFQDFVTATIPFNKGIIGSIIASGKSECVPDANLDPRSFYPAGAAVKDEQLMVIPLNIGLVCWGAMVINRFSKQKFSSKEFELAQFLASYASLALNNIQLIERISGRERSLRKLLEAIPDHPIKLDAAGTILEGSFSSAGAPQTIYEIFPPAIATQFLNAVVQVLESQSSVSFEFQFEAEGLTKYFEARVIPFSNFECLLLTRDLTKMHQAEAELQDTQSLKQVIMDTISDAVVTVDHAQRIIYCNEMTEKIFGYQPDELIGASLQLLVPDYLKKLHDHAFTQYNATGLRKHASWSSLAFPGLHKDGREIPLEISFGEAKVNGQRVFSAIIRDVSERSRADEKLQSTTSRLQNLILTIQAGVLVEDENRRIVLTNKKFCDMFEIPAPPEALTGMDCTDAADNSKHLFKKPESFVQQIQELLRNRVTVVNEELEMTNGKVYARDYVPIFVDKAYKGHMWLYRDVSDNKEVEKNLMKAKQMAEESGNAKQDFLARMSHELRTPINGVLGLTNLMYNSSLSSENLEYLNGIRSSGEQLLSIINDILDLSKIEAGKLKLDAIDFNPRRVITQLMKNLQPQADEKHLLLECKIFNEIPDYVVGDPVRLNQILLNLLSNALKFTLEGSVSLQCSVAQQTGDTYFLKFTVTDTGIGIQQAKLQTIFERFTQADHNTSVKFGGTGLGLTIVKQLTEMQHGDVHVQSVMGMGTTFEVIIPYQKGNQRVDDPVQETSWTNHQSFAGANILLVEDNLINQTVARKTLEKWNIDVTVAENGRVALRHLAGEKKFNLIIMDVQMPEMDGYETTYRIRNEMPEPIRSTPIVAMTASVLFDPESRVKSAGMNEYISKPFKLQELNAILAKYLVASASAKPPVAPPPAKSLLDLSFLDSISPGNVAFQVEMAELFQKQTELYMTNIRQALKNRDNKSLEKNAHAIKPLGAYIGINTLTDLVGQLERRAMEDPKNPGDVDSLFARIENLLKEIKPEIENFVLLNKDLHAKE